MFEDSFLFSDTVRNNIAYGRPHATDADVVHAAEVAGARLHPRCPTVTTPRSANGGSRCREASANGSPSRAVLTDPRVLVLDDATSSIDARTEEQIHATLRDVTEHRTTIVIAHRRSTLRLADRIVVVEHGRGREGTLDELTATSAGSAPFSQGPTTSMARATRSVADGDGADAAVTPRLWMRDGAVTGATVRPFVPVRSAGWGARGSRHGRRRRGRWPHGRAGAAGALTPTPELEAAIAGLPPADDEPHVDTAAEAAGSETFRLRDFLRPCRRPLLVGFGLVAFGAL